MAKFSTIAQGALARRRCEMSTVSGAPFSCDLRVTTSADDADILAGARAFAEAKGIKDPKSGDPLYDLGSWVHTVLVTAIDPDVTSKHEPYFDGGVDQVLAHLDRDRLALLVERQAELQESVCPGGKRSLTVEQLTGSMLEAAGLKESDELPFDRWPPALRRTSWHSMALLLAELLTSRVSKSASTSPSASTTISDGAKAEAAEKSNGATGQ